MEVLLECVPNFSEGRDAAVIKQITDAIESVSGVQLLDVDMGADANRTVVTFVGAPEAVVEAAYLGIAKAAELIDMQKHSGEHPRMGATDVCPLVPISGITMPEAAALAKKLAQRVAENLQIPIYLYEAAASRPERKNLANIRAGEYEGLPEKLKDPDWQPDFGAPILNPKAGATVIGARDFLIAYNINLNTRSVRKANALAFDLREAGRIARKGHPVIGEVIKDEKGEPLRIPGALPGVKAIGWYMEEYGVAQVSMNLTDLSQTPLHIAFERSCEKAQERGLRVTGSEIVGMIPLNAILEAGKYFCKKQGVSAGVSEEELIHIAIKSMGLAEVSPFIPEQKIIEYKIRRNQARLVQMTVRNFVNETASDSPAPGGGSVSALVGAMGAALAAMVANLSASKHGWENRFDAFSNLAVRSQNLKDVLLRLVDDDTAAFNAVMEAMKAPKSTADEQAKRMDAIITATQAAIETPILVMRRALEALVILKEVALNGNPNSISDAAVGALCAKTAAEGAYLNVLINLSGLDDHARAELYKNDAKDLLGSAVHLQNEILNHCYKVLLNQPKG